MKKKYLLLTALTLSAVAATAQTPVFADEATANVEEVQAVNRAEERTVVSRYLDTNGNRIIEDVMGDAGQKEIPGYTFKSFAAGVDKGEDGNLFGVYFYTYEKVEEEAVPENTDTTTAEDPYSNFISIYTDVNGNMIAPQEKGQAGVKEIPGYKHVSSGAGNYKGQPSFGYVYEKIEEATAPEDKDTTSTDAKVEDRTVVSRYLDTNGNRIIEDVMGDGGLKEIPGYTFKSFAAGVDKGEDGNLFGVYFYTYEKVEEEEVVLEDRDTTTAEDPYSNFISIYTDVNGNMIAPQEKGQAGVKEIPGYKHVSSGAGNY
ncbi:hypothetical protein E5983_08045, partial [Streptococcus danieliae]